MKTTEAERQKIREVISQGLVSGLGKPKPGRMCVEAAVNFAKGRPHGDAPPCVAKPDRAYAIRINDAAWSSPQARAKALLPLALAQLDTAGKGRRAWVSYLALHTVTRILPLILEKSWPSHAAACRGAKTLKEACDAAYAADAAGAVSAVDYAAYAADDAAAYGASYDAADDAADDDDYGAAGAAADAAAGAAAGSGAADEILSLSVQIALEAYALEAE